MIRLLVCTLIAALSPVTWASTKLDLKAVTVASAVQLIYSETLKASFVLAPELLADNRIVSFRHEADEKRLRGFLATFLDSLGYSVESRGGIDFISKKKAADGFSANDEDFLYRPKYRDVAYMARLLQPVFSGHFAVSRQVKAGADSRVTQHVPEGSAASLIEQDIDLLLFSGSRAEIAKLESLLAVIDRPAGEVAVRGLVYEVSTSRKDGSALKVAAELLSGKIAFGIGSSLVPAETTINLKGASFDAVITALSGDSRFKAVSSPTLRIRSGAVGHFSVGQEVPVLGALSYPQGASQPVQSIEYRSSGVIFEVEPQVREEVVDLRISQQLSNFVRTETGVNGSPTLMKRSVETEVTVVDGDLVLLGGLAEAKDTSSSTGLPLLPWLGARQSERSQSEILLILQLQKI